MDYKECWTKRLGVSKYSTCHISFGRSEGNQDTCQPFGHLAELQTGHPRKSVGCVLGVTVVFIVDLTVKVAVEM